MKKSVIAAIAAVLVAIIAIAAICVTRWKNSGGDSAEAPSSEATEGFREEESVPGEAAQEDTASGSWKEAYRTVLYDVLTVSEELPGFSLIYLNNDDIPELVICIDTYENAKSQLYTFSAGKAVYLGQYGSSGQFTYYEKEGLLAESSTTMGITYNTVYKLNGAVMDKAFESNDDSGWVGEDHATFRIGDEEVDRARYDESWEQAKGSKKNEKLTGCRYKLTKSVVDEVFG